MLIWFSGKVKKFTGPRRKLKLYRQIYINKKSFLYTLISLRLLFFRFWSISFENLSDVSRLYSKRNCHLSNHHKLEIILWNTKFILHKYHCIFFCLRLLLLKIDFVIGKCFLILHRFISHRTRDGVIDRLSSF